MTLAANRSVARRTLVIAIALSVLVGTHLPAIAELEDAGPYVSGDRIAGADRYETAAAIAERAFPDGADEVFLANGTTFADAVAGGTLTTGPILLVPPCTRDLPDVVEDQVSRLAPGRVTALGGPDAVCDDHLHQAAGHLPTDRIAGADRYETAAAIAERAFPDGADEVFLANGTTFADAVAGGTLTTGPILLVRADRPVPDAVASQVHWLAPKTVFALGGERAISATTLASATAAAPCRLRSSTDLGPASLDAPLVTGALDGTELHTVTRGLRPATLSTFDLGTEAITRSTALPGTSGAWASVLVDDHLYVGTYGQPHLYRVDVSGEELVPELLHTFSREEVRTVYAIAAGSDGTVVVGTSRDAGVHIFDADFDPDADEPVTLAPLVEGEEIVRSLLVTETHIYAGIGAHAHLIEIDRDTHETRDLLGELPDELAEETFVYTLALAPDGRRILAGTEPSAYLALIDPDDPDGHEVVQATGARTIDAIAVAEEVDGDVVYATARTEGRLYRAPIEDLGALAQRAVPLPGEETRALFHRETELVGVGGSGSVWRLPTDGDQVGRVDLTEVGLEPGPEPIESVAWLPGVAYVGGHWGIQVHDLAGRTSERVRIAGEPKAMVDADGVLYAALYPSGEIHRYDPADAASPVHVATIGDDQIRPRDAHFDEEQRRILVGTQPEYGHVSGALTLLDPDSGALEVHRGIVGDHSVRAVTSHGGTAYLGSEVRGGIGAEEIEDEARLVAYDLDDLDEPIWQVVPTPGSAGIAALVATEDVVYGLTGEGLLFAVDAATGEVAAPAPRSFPATGGGLVLKESVLYVSSGGRIIGVDPSTFADIETDLWRGGYGFVADRPVCGLIAARNRLLSHVSW